MPRRRLAVHTAPSIVDAKTCSMKSLALKIHIYFFESLSNPKDSEGPKLRNSSNSFSTLDSFKAASRSLARHGHQWFKLLRQLASAEAAPAPLAPLRPGAFSLELRGRCSGGGALWWRSWPWFTCHGPWLGWSLAQGRSKRGVDSEGAMAEATGTCTSWNSMKARFAMRRQNSIERH